jgi:oligopeptide transport system substrate-binding protein
VLTATEAAKAKNAGAVVHTWQDAVRGVYFNTAVPALANADVRRALRDAIEWSTIYNHLTAAGESKATAYIPPAAKIGNETYRGTHTYTTQVDTARTALGKGLAALYPDKNSPALPSLTFLAAQDSISADTARYIVQSWQKNLKISCTLELVSEETLKTRVTSGNYQIALYTAVGGGLSAADNLVAYTSNAAGNLTGYADTAFDAAVATALRGSREQVVAAETKLRNACPVIELSFPPRYYGVAANCEDVSIRPFGGGAYGNAYVFLHAKKFDD